MASKNQVTGKKKTKDETPKKTQGLLSNQEKNDLAKKIKNLEHENNKLSLENVMFKNNFDLREIINVLSQKGVTEWDEIEITKNMVKKALEEADEKHSAEKKNMERKHEKEIEILRQKLHGADQQPTQSNAKKAFEEEKQKLEAEIQKLQNENLEQKHSYEKSIDLIEKNQDTISKPVNPNDIHLLLRETMKEKDDAKSEKKALLEEKQKLEAKIQKLQKENKEEKISYEKTKDLMEREKGALLADKQKLDAEINRLQDEIKALKQSEDKNKSLNEKNQDSISKPVNPDDIQVLLREATKEKDDAKSEKKALLKEKQKLEAEIQKLQNEKKEEKISYEKTKDLMEIEKGALLADKQKVDAEIKRLQDEIKALKQSEEKNKSLNEKLRELTSTQTAFNNPSIAELSDAFRPMKLSERYSQLYDNMWTDAFEEHSGKKEEDIIQMLRERLLGSYKFCENVCREFTVQLTNSTLALPNSKPKNVDIPIGYKKQLQEIKKNFGVFLRNDVKESYRKQNTIEGGDKTKNYIDACVELCWLMVIQEPPVVLETPAPKDSTFDTNTYMTYTTTGTKVDFVVWPALRLHHGGPLLSKGVAQEKK